MARVTFRDAQAFAKEHRILTINANRYLELAAGDETLAVKIVEYYRGTGVEQPLMVGEIIREHWMGPVVGSLKGD